MKWIASLLFACTVGETMEPFDVLRKFENLYSAIKPAEVDREEAFVWLTDIPHPLFNAVMHLSCGNTAQEVDAILEKLPHGHPISFWVHPENQAEGLAEELDARGFQKMIACPLMSVPVEAADAPQYEIRSAEDWDSFLEILKVGFHFDERAIEGYGRLLGPMENYLLYLDGAPVATGSLLSGAGTGGVFNIATLPEHRKKGCAKAMMQFLMNRAARAGLAELILMSSPEAEKIYAGIGFTRLFVIEIYARGISL